MKEKFYDIHVAGEEGSNNGYSIFLNAQNKEKAIAYAIERKLFTEEGDEDFIDNITEIDEDEYLMTTEQKGQNNAATD